MIKLEDLKEEDCIYTIKEGKIIEMDVLKSISEGLVKAKRRRLNWLCEDIILSKEDEKTLFRTQTEARKYC